MVMINIQLFILSAFALTSGARALAVVPMHNVLSRSLSAQVLPRQNSGVTNTKIDYSGVPECKDPCTKVTNFQNVSGKLEQIKEDLKCQCTDTNGDLLAACFNCIVTNGPEVLTEAQGQSAMNAFVNPCNAAAFPVKAQTIRKTSGNGAVRDLVGLGVTTAVMGALLVAAAVF
ncbi:hypothetical protein AAF712_015622 [Marasmius tenuissimus]|uniref:Uncharacterized protein n=1 Tax=Marasmius tenuissimus TaxID=585030 RepID=A0ABR2Z8R1_9AGAR